jgi:S-(hydroxymethyl)glutathione dehydrogenase / alcohol dehydrogenase
MRAAVLDKFGEPLTEAEVELAEPAADEVLVRVTDSGICHSDRTVQLGSQDRPLPLVLGHEAAGVVERVGSGVSGLQPGDHVVGCNSANCGQCLWCARGQPQHCSDKGQERADGSPRLFLPARDRGQVHAFVGLGGFAERMLVSQRALVRIPPEMPLDKAALLGCAVLTGMGAVLHRAKVRAGQTVAVIGCGGVGLNAVQAARLAGAGRIIAVDIKEAKLERARIFGATDTVDASREDSVATVVGLSGGGVDHAVEVVGSGPTIEQAFGMTGVRGTTTVVGVPLPAATVTLPALVFMAAEKKVQGSRMGSASFRADVPLYCELYLRGQLLLDELISEVIDLGGVNQGLAALDGSDGARSVIHFG